VIWDKGNWTAGSLKDSLAVEYEVIFLGIKGSGWQYRGERERCIWHIPRVGTNRVHPTEKPVELYEKLITISTDQGALIIDPYGGSFSSAIAAINTGRNYVGIDIDKDYYELGKERVDKAWRERSNEWKS
jgi:site-specific DNA-methyltransferase (adenine-specific)